MREIRGEARQAPTSLRLASTRGNDFIHRLKDASENPGKAKAKAKGKAKAKAKGKTKGKPERDPLEAEPVFATLEEAEAQAKECTKCVAKKDGSKGCRSCMGEFFETQRRRGFWARALKDAQRSKDAPRDS